MKESEILEKIFLAKKGDKEAFSLLFKNFYEPTMRFAVFRLQGDRDRAEDIVAQAFLNWYQSLENYVPTKKPLNYLYLIISRLLINEGVKSARVEKIDEDEFLDIESQERDPIEVLDISLEYDQIKNIIDKELGESERSVIYLKYIEERKNTEIAEMLEKSENNIRQIEYRALKKIREKYKQKYEN